MKKLKTVLTVVATLPFATLAQASGEKGNGGDFIRQIFIERGNQIVSFLEKNEKNSSFSKANKISPQSLKNVFRIEVIRVSADPLTDNQGSIVDALGSVGKVVLNQSAWRTYIVKGI